MAGKSKSPGLTAAQPGDRYTYQHPQGSGYGESALGDPLTAEMTELDLASGTEVVIHAMDEETGWPIAEWTDTHGINRLTTIDEATFVFFIPAGG